MCHLLEFLIFMAMVTFRRNIVIFLLSFTNFYFISRLFLDHLYYKTEPEEVHYPPCRLIQIPGSSSISDMTSVTPSLNNSIINQNTTSVEQVFGVQDYPDPLSIRSKSTYYRDNYTVLLITYKREDILPRVFDFHCKNKFIDRIIVIWNNIDEPNIPSHLLKYKCAVEILFKHATVNSLNNRFFPYPEIRTEGQY